MATIPNAFASSGTKLQVVGSRIYGNDGTVTDAISGARLGQFAFGGDAIVVDAASNLAYVDCDMSSNPVNDILVLDVFDTNSFLPVTSLEGVESPLGLFLYGSAGLAMCGEQGLYFCASTPGRGSVPAVKRRQ